MGDQVEVEDPRVVFISFYTLKTLKLKSERWSKFYTSTDENKNIIMNFLNKNEINIIFLSTNQNQAIVISLGVPNQKLKTKSCYFAKKKPGPVSTDVNIRDEILYGDISASPLEQFAVILDDVLMPMFLNNRNHWPPCISETLIREISVLRNKTCIITGQMKGRTQLPIPINTRKLTTKDVERVENGGGVDIDVLKSIESIIMDWSQIIHSVILTDSSELLDEGLKPGPLAEIEFWKERLENMENIYNQLNTPYVKLMENFLLVTKSTYYAAFCTLYRQILDALDEADEINIYLKPLIPYFEYIEINDLSKLTSIQFETMLHTICLLWSNSFHFRKQIRILVLMEELSNILLRKAITYLEPHSLFKNEIDESMEKIKIADSVLNDFLAKHDKYKAKVLSYFKSGVNAVEWEYTSDLLFSQMSDFIKRINMIKELFCTASDYSRLEKVEIGGIKGKSLSHIVVKIFAEFKDEFEKFGTIKYDPLDITIDEFYKDYEYFIRFVLDLDRQLSTVIMQAFDDCINLNGIFKLITVLGVLLQRPVIKRDFEPNYQLIINLLGKEMDETKKILDAQNERKIYKKSFRLHKNMPIVSGTIKICQELRNKIQKPIMLFDKLINHPIKQSDEMKNVRKKYDELLFLIKTFAITPYREWCTNVAKLTDFNLSKNLIERDKSSQKIKINFDFQLSSVIREVKYLRTFNEEPIPEPARMIFEQGEEFISYQISLEEACSAYNRIIRTAKEEERLLINNELKEIDNYLLEAEYKLTWKTKDINDYIENLKEKIVNLCLRLKKTKKNVIKIKSLLGIWKNVPLYRRCENGKNRLLLLDDVHPRFLGRKKEIEQLKKKISELIDENAQLFKVTNTRSGAWRSYIAYIDEKLLECLLQIVSCSLSYLLKETNYFRLDVEPLFKVDFVLQNGLDFQPCLESDTEGNLVEQSENLIDHIFKQASIIPRLCTSKNNLNFKEELENFESLCKMKKDFLDRLIIAINNAKEYKNSFEKYAYLWEDDQNEFLRQFLLYGHIPTQEERDKYIKTGIPETPPTLDMFKKNVENYESIYIEVKRIEDYKIINKWFIIDCKKFKTSLLGIIKEWSFMFKKHLLDSVTNSLRELDEFVRIKEDRLSKELKEGDFKHLVEMMGHLADVREKQFTYDNMFEPIKQKLTLIKSFGLEIPSDVYDKLMILPDKWNQVRKLSLQAKQIVAPLQIAEVSNIRRKIANFENEQFQFKKLFIQEAPFKANSKNPYQMLDHSNKILNEMETRMIEIQTSAQLFEIPTPDFKEIHDCRRDIKILKPLWDYAFITKSTFKDWYQTKWREINSEAMENECKNLTKDLRAFDKEIRIWDAYIGIDNDIKNIMISLRAVTDLQNPAIKNRHWKELMNATNVQFNLTENTKFCDLLELNLHKYEDEAKTIVDKAIKESLMEKVLKDLDATWANMEFKVEPHSRTQVPLLQASDELIETLEDNQVQLQNMITSKYIGFFLKEVSEWQKNLSQADQVIQILLEVQRTWSHLESIFIGSEDIRNQLPEDSARFDGIDSDFKQIAFENKEELNVVKCTNRFGLYEKLEDIQSRLNLCEKALAEYLEKKRLAFPRFYFISGADLLDILSNGNEPDKIRRHLTKLFDSIARLKLNNDVTNKISYGMWAKDGEYVEFPTTCDLNGQVEVWLKRLLEKQCKTVWHWLSLAVHEYENKTRENWIIDYPGQIALTGSQIWWSTEVNTAFAKLEEGFENSLKDYCKKQIAQLNALITMLLSDLSKGDRQKIMTICTIDVHARDVVMKMIANKTESASEFLWQCQLRHRWDDDRKDCFANICDAQFKYAYEYLGNQPRLVITPLTDRCYITLTQSLHLIMGGAPTGPAGTGKTETTKDLGRSLGVIVYVFNCSEQMDYRSCGNIYKGLAQTGAWGCFDEFNRIQVEVLSVVAVQVKSIQDAIKLKKRNFIFMEEEISLNLSVGIFVTMNPGYAGRTELPENLKVLFRPCAMVVPDFDLICEIMLVAEGFTEARLLARKFITLYTLCRELLSKQDHYDWGLRAIKSVLVVAGSLRRGDRGRPEDQVLMRALRDFNIPKIVNDDLPIFMGLIGDLFPALDVPRKRDIEFEKQIKQAVIDLKLQPEENFIIKVVQLQELFDVRHSVFIVGGAGTGKSQIWKSLYKAYHNQKRKPVAIDLNPKAVTNDELFGNINPVTREWKDGLFSVIMRDLANMTSDGPKWVVLDGDIDPMWIESLNTVMDDNKVLTLASNERIALTPSMRLLFEISNLRTATPATVSRAGILYINSGDLGWNPPVISWIETRESQNERAYLSNFFDKYCPLTIEAIRLRYKKITPIPESSHIQFLCNLLDVILTPQNTSIDFTKETYELYFVFSCVWAFGSALFQDQTIDYRVEFSKWWTNEFKTVQFPLQGTVFDYYIDDETKHFKPWSNLVPKFIFSPEVPLQSTLVNTFETIRIRYFMDLLVKKGKPVMLVGNAGTGKTVLINDKLKSLSEEWLVANVPFNFYTTSEMLQTVLEKPLEKKAGRNYGPPGNKRLIYFIDDMNIPEVDQYGTVQPHSLLRQHLDYNHWYDRQKLNLKEIHNCQYIACMNPTAGSFEIDSRLQRHFAVFAFSFPGYDALFTIYNSILSDYFSIGFSEKLQEYIPHLINGALALHQKITLAFLPTAIKFHYIFNLRDLSNIFQGILYSKPDTIKTIPDLIRLYIHEAERVYSDKLVDKHDLDLFNKIERETLKKFEDFNEEECFRRPIIFCHFGQTGETKYSSVSSWRSLNKILTEALENYNELYAVMNLVLFDDAMMHICRINRILELPRGNALLIGVGGSGKQSLTRLAASISSLEVFQISLRKGYSIVDMKADIAQLYIKCGQKGTGSVFLMTDAQIADEKFLVLINDMLASGEIPGLLTDDAVEEVINNIRGEVKSVGIDDTRENCWKFFIDKVRRLLKIVLCFSPVGSALKNRSRKFPAITNTTCIDWFHEWPQEALISVAKRFLSEIESLDSSLQDSASSFMAYVHKSVNDMSTLYFQNDKRYNYTTPKSYLEQISLYKRLLMLKYREIQDKIMRLENGLIKLKETAKQVDELKAILAVQEVEVKKKNEDADKLIKVVRTETEKVSQEKAIADEEQKRVQIISIEVTQKQKECEADLIKAEPALIAAQTALDTLDKTNLTEMKSFPNPPPAVLSVTGAVMCLMAPGGRIPKDRSWKAAKSFMGNVDKFLEQLKTYDKENIPETCRREVMKYIADEEFNPELVRTKSAAAAGLCSWVINILRFYEIYCDVAPKRAALNKANAELQQSKEKLQAVEKKVNDLEDEIKKLTREFEIASEAKLKVEREAKQTENVINLANRLVNGLASEKIRWTDSVNNLKAQEKHLPGNILLITAFVSYVGSFTKQYRVDLLEKHWIPFMESLRSPIPKTPQLDILSLLIDDADVAIWNNEGLPSDRMSTENATILTNCDRWPLMIDPQLQGIKWIKTKYADRLKVIRLGQKGYLDKIEQALTYGQILLIENIEESIEAVLDPLIGRNTIKRGKAIKIGDKEIEYHPDFRLILHTKLANPHYKPEIQAQTTLINFTVTKDGLEDQLLADVVAKERPDLEKLKFDLTKDQNAYKIKLKQLEDNLLAALSAAEGNFLEDTVLVENLENTKSMAKEIEEKVKQAKVTTIKIDEARELYRPAAARASLIYFIMNDLHKIHPMYQFSLKAFKVVFAKAIEKAEITEDIRARVSNLIECITYSVFIYTTRGLFEKHKLIFTSQMVFLILQAAKEIDSKELDFLLRFPIIANVTSPVEFLSDYSWGGIKSLSSLAEFNNLDRDIESSQKRWKKFVESETPEKEKFPQEWKNKSAVQKLCMMRCLRPDRMLYALSLFVKEKLGKKYVETRSVDFASSYEETTPSTPVFFILSPGVDPLKDVESLGYKLGFSSVKRNFHNISLGQGQEIVAEKAMETSAKQGHWVVLQNVHLVASWLSTLEKHIEMHAETSHPNFRLFISAEPASEPAGHIIPQGILETAIKITNEPPTGMKANLHKALDNFNQDTLEMCAKEIEFKAILFSLCYFHAVVAERRKFGAQGWNRKYPFNNGDLNISMNVLYNYLEANNKIPWENLRYLFGEIMYGGHITDDWDRRLCRAYLEEYMNQIMFDGELYLAPGFPVPSSTDYKGYHLYIDDELPPESPYLYGLHPNAEIDFLTSTSEALFRTVLELQPRDMNAENMVDGAQTRDEKIKQRLDEILERLPEEFPIRELMSKAEDKSPYTIVALQECERLNILTREIKRTLRELNLGLKGELTITAKMEALQDSLFLDQIPESWEKRAYPSLYTLGLWFMDLLQRIKELEMWTCDFQLPVSVWISGLFNPQSFLTAIMQTTARKNEWPLDKMCLHVEVTKRSREELGGHSRDGAYLHGVFMEGARWDIQNDHITDAKLKELQMQMPVLLIKAIPIDRREIKNTYECPIYKTKERGPTYVWTFNLRTKDKPTKWVLAGVCLLCQI